MDGYLVRTSIHHKFYNSLLIGFILNNNGFWCFDISAPESINSLYIIPLFYALSCIVYSLLFSINLSRLYIKLTAIRRKLSLALMTIGLSHRYVVLKRQYILKRSSLYQESSFSYFLFLLLFCRLALFSKIR